MKLYVIASLLGMISIAITSNAMAYCQDTHARWSVACDIIPTSNDPEDFSQVVNVSGNFTTNRHPNDPGCSALTQEGWISMTPTLKWQLNYQGPTSWPQTFVTEDFFHHITNWGYVISADSLSAYSTSLLSTPIPMPPVGGGVQIDLNNFVPYRSWNFKLRSSNQVKHFRK